MFIKCFLIKKENIKKILLLVSIIIHTNFNYPSLVFPFFIETKIFNEKITINMKLY